MVPLALVVAMVCIMQTAAVARTFPSDDGKPDDVSRDFAGVGAGSILAGLIGAFPVDASPPSTAIVRESGGRSPDRLAHGRRADDRPGGRWRRA